MPTPVQHLLHRASFGSPSPAHLLQSVGQVVNELVDDEVRGRPLNLIAKPDLTDLSSGDLRANVRQLQEKSRDQIVALNVAWLGRLAEPESAFREKMTLFWHNHFACRARFPYLAQLQNNTLRQHALGSFRDLLKAVSRDPAMLLFLNNQQNRKGNPNENFARELMELFTVGKGNYSENDIKNAARAFTGWGTTVSGEFVFRQGQHDGGEKSFRSIQGHFSGEDILDLLLDDRQTARFITTKIWRHFVSSEILDQEIIASLADSFYESDYRIDELMRKIFKSDWFYHDRFIATRIKSPVDLLAGLLVHTQGRFVNDASSLFPQRTLGQVLFNPPGVAGWPNGRAWIDSSSLLLRLSLAGMLMGGSPPAIKSKDDGDVNNPVNGVSAREVGLLVDWPKKLAQFGSNTKLLFEEVEQFLLTRPTTSANRKLIENYCQSSDDERELIQRIFIGLMSMPEYQLS